MEKVRNVCDDLPEDAFLPSNVLAERFSQEALRSYEEQRLCAQHINLKGASHSAEDSIETQLSGFSFTAKLKAHLYISVCHCALFRLQ